MQETNIQEEIEPAALKTHPKEWESKGFRYRIIKREGMVVIAEVTSPDSPGYLTWEVAILRRNPPGHRFGKDFTASESYPRSEEWGTRGFTCHTREAASRRFASLT